MTEPNFSAIRARLRYDSVDEFIDGYSRYVTAGGMFIPMTPAKLKPVGTTVRFQFVLGDGATALLGEGVVRQIRGLENEDTDSPIGMLVKFTKLSQDSKILIDRILALKEIEKLGVDISSGDAYSDAENDESAEHAATTGNYSLAELAHSASGLLTGSEDEDELGELFSDRTGRLEASELAGLGASSYGDNFNQPNNNNAGDHSTAAVEKQVEVAKPFQEWGPEPEDEEKKQANSAEMSGSGELSLDPFTFNTDDFEKAASSDVFMSGESSNELAFEFDFDMQTPAEPAELVESVVPAALSSDDFSITADLFGEESDFPEFSMDDVIESSDVSGNSEPEVEQSAVHEESATQEGESKDVVSKSEEQVTSHVVRETLGGLQIMSFDGSADASVDRDFEKFAAGSEDDVDSMFDDVFGDAFDGAFGGIDDGADISEPEKVESGIAQVDDAEIVSEVAAEVDVLEQTAKSEEPSVVPSITETVSEEVAEDISEEPSEESLASILFGEESEAFSADVIDEEVVEEFVSESEVSKSAIDALELSEEFDLSEISGEKTTVGDEEVFEVEDMEAESSDGDELIVEEVSAEIPKIPEIQQATVPAPPAFAARSIPESRQDVGVGQSENSSELLSLLGALEASEAEEDELTLGARLSLSHGLHDKSSPVLDDEPDSFSALLASAQKELDARNATSEEDRHRDAIDELLGDDEMPLPPIPVASPFAMPEIPDKKRKGFMSKLFGKD